MFKNFQLAIVLNISLISLWGCGTNMSKYESQDYVTKVQEGDFEIRDYKPGLMAVTPITGSNSSFRRIFNYISGENSASEKISMTVPVRMSPNDTRPWMAFFMPKKYTESTLPKPTGSNVEVATFPGGLFAAIRFSGLAGEEQAKEKFKELKVWCEIKGYTANQPWFLDRYDPPWTLWFMRTNEVVAPVE